MNRAMIGAAALLLFNHYPEDTSSSSSESSNSSESEGEEIDLMEVDDEFYLAVLDAIDEGPEENWNPDPNRPRDLDDVKRRLDDDTFLPLHQATYRLPSLPHSNSPQFPTTGVSY